MLQLHPVYSLCNRRKTLTGSPDPMCAMHCNAHFACKVVDEVLTHNRDNNDAQTNTYEQAYYEVIVMHCV